MFKFIKKILFLFLIIFILYILIIFRAPVLAEKIESIFGITGFNQGVIDFKNSLDSTLTNIPSKEEFKNTYNQALSGAVHLKGETIGGIETVKDGVDNIRLSISGSVNKYEGIKDNIIETKEQIQNTVDVIKETSNSISELSENVSNTFSGAVNTNLEL